MASHSYRIKRSPIGLAGDCRLCSLRGTNWLCTARLMCLKTVVLILRQPLLCDVMFTARTARKKGSCHAVSRLLCCSTTVVSATKYIHRTTICARSGRMQTVCVAAIHWQLLARWILLEKLTVPRLVKVLTACYVTQRFITAFTGIRHLFLSWARLIQSTLSHSIPALLCPLLQQQTTLTQSQNVLLLLLLLVLRSGSAGRPATGPLYRGRSESTDRSHAHSLLPERKHCFSNFLVSFWTSSM
jgi:hypothetical protein